MTHFPRSRDHQLRILSLLVTGASMVFCGSVSAQSSDEDGGIRFWKKPPAPGEVALPKGMNLERSLPVFDGVSAEPSLSDPSNPAGAQGRALERFEPTGPPPANLRKPTAPKKPAALEPADPKDSAFNPKFGLPEFDLESMEPVVPAEGEVVTASGRSLQQYVAPPASLKPEKVKPVKPAPTPAAPEVITPKPVSNGTTPEQEELYSRLPMPAFVVPEPAPAGMDSGPLGAQGERLQQFEPTGPPPKRKDLEVEDPEIAAARIQAKQDKAAAYYAADEKFAMPKLDLEALMESQAPRDPNQPMTSSGGELKQFVPSAAPQKTRKKAEQPAPASEPQAKVELKRSESVITDEEFYDLGNSDFSMPILTEELASVAQGTSDPSQPTDSSGHSLKQFSPDPAAVARIQAEKAREAAVSPEVAQKAAEAEQLAKLKKASEYYGMTGPFGLPEFDPASLAVPKATDGPATASGGALKQFSPTIAAQ